MPRFFDPCPITSCPFPTTPHNHPTTAAEWARKVWVERVGADDIEQEYVDDLAADFDAFARQQVEMAWQATSRLIEQFHADKYEGAPIGDGCHICDLWHTLLEGGAEGVAGMSQPCGKVMAQMCPQRYEKSPHVCWDTLKKKGASHPMPHRCGFCGKEFR